MNQRLRHPWLLRQRGFISLALIMICLLVGCGTTKQHTATEQLLMSDAVDGAVAKINFMPLEGQKVYLDDQYIRNYKGIGFVNSDYIISSLRQQMVGAGLLLFEKKEDADFIVEARIGTLGADSHEVVFGIPANNALSAAATAAAAVSQIPASIPGIPEISFARRQDEHAAAKIGVFAYERESRQRVWQSGISIGQSESRDLWLFGAGPFQNGGIHHGDVVFAGSSLDVPIIGEDRAVTGPKALYRKGVTFKDPAREAALTLAEAEVKAAEKIVQAVAEQEATEEPGQTVVPASAETVEPAP